MWQGDAYPHGWPQHAQPPSSSHLQTEYCAQGQTRVGGLHACNGCHSTTPLYAALRPLSLRIHTPECSMFPAARCARSGWTEHNSVAQTPRTEVATALGGHVQRKVGPAAQHSTWAAGPLSAQHRRARAIIKERDCPDTPNGAIRSDPVRTKAGA